MENDSVSTIRSFGARLRRFLVLIALVFSLYLGSFGPALSLAHRGYLSPAAMSTIYAFMPLKIRLWYWRIWKRLDQKLEGKLLACAPPRHLSTSPPRKPSPLSGPD
jgi:hypothetical protein